ncbi:MAG: M23 family metallopeptidase [Bacillota bacterium]
MLVPHFGERTYQIRLPVRFFRRLLAAVILLCAMIVGLLQSYSIMQGNMQELARLRHETSTQRSLLQSLSGRAMAMQEREARVADLEGRVRALIEEDSFLPAHVKAQLLGALGGKRSRESGASAASSGAKPAALPQEEAVLDGAEGGGYGLPPASPPSPESLRRAVPLSSRAMSRMGGPVAAGAGAGASVAAALSPSGTEAEGPLTDGHGSGPWLGDELGGDLARATSSADAAVDRLASLEQVLARRQDVLLSLPQCMPVMGRLTSGFGYRRSPFGRRLEFHEGVDLAAPRGTPVRVVADGVVVFAGYKPGLGRTVTVDHGNGIQTVYGHHSSLMVRAGQHVKAGDVVAAVGDTGRATGDHLHFELHFNGRVVDPWPYLQRLGGGG